ncbi:MAG: hypothetical protein F6K30_18585 [Cyanothece sp. SIO2G6]|nr:hypothetical protein [Cyanothece sp. SIO2G6]
MDEQKRLLAQTMAFLMCTTPETMVGKLLNFCLATKVDAQKSSKTPLEFAEDLLDHPEKLASWVSEVIDSDDQYSVEEMLAVSEIPLDNSQKFMDYLLAEVGDLDTQGL